LRITSAKPQPLALRLRVPAWAAGSTVKINGKPLEAAAEPGSYLTIHRTWKTGDSVEMSLPMRLTVEAMPDDATTQAFLYGPLVLAGDLGNEGLTEELTIGTSGPAMYRPRPNPQPAAATRVGLQVSQTVQMDQAGQAVPVPAAPTVPPPPPRPQRPSAPPIEIPTFQADGDDPARWIKPSDQPLTFHTTGQKKDVKLTPLNALFDKRYSVYWKVS
jgi:hypothetical protein